MTTSSENYGHFWKGSEILRNFWKLWKSFETVFVLKQFLKIFGNLWIIFRIFWKISEMVQNGIRNFWKFLENKFRKQFKTGFWELLWVFKYSEIFRSVRKSSERVQTVTVFLEFIRLFKMFGNHWKNFARIIGTVWRKHSQEMKNFRADFEKSSKGP